MTTFRNILLIVWPLVFGVSQIQADQPPEHLMMDCINCHNQHGDDPAQIDSRCLTCHDSTLPEAAEVAGVFHLGGDLSCSTCHGYHSTEKLKARGASFERPFGDMAVRNHCDACHSNVGSPTDLSAGHVTASSRYHIDASLLVNSRISEVCQSCHDENSYEPEVPPETPAFAVHGSHIVGVRIPAPVRFLPSTYRRVIDERLQLYNSVLECTTCHQLTAETDWRLVPFASRTGLCLGCHDMSPGRDNPDETTIRPFMVAGRDRQ